MSMRPPGVVVLVLVLVLGPGGGGPAFGQDAGETETEAAVEEEPPAIEEITRSTTAEQFLPEPYEQPAWFRFLLFPLLGVALVAVTAVLLLYLKWQPHFAEERSRKRRR